MECLPRLTAGSAKVKACVRVDLDDEYPRSRPSITIEKGFGLSDENERAILSTTTIFLDSLYSDSWPEEGCCYGLFDAILDCLDDVSKTLSCCICFDEIAEEGGVSAPQCWHAFHTPCLAQWWVVYERKARPNTDDLRLRKLRGDVATGKESLDAMAEHNDHVERQLQKALERQEEARTMEASIKPGKFSADEQITLVKNQVREIGIDIHRIEAALKAAKSAIETKRDIVEKLERDLDAAEKNHQAEVAKNALLTSLPCPVCRSPVPFDLTGRDFEEQVGALREVPDDASHEPLPTAPVSSLSEDDQALVLRIQEYQKSLQKKKKGG